MSALGTLPDWHGHGLCNAGNRHLFWPPEHKEKHAQRLTRERAALAICHACPFEAICADWAAGAGRMRNTDLICGGVVWRTRKDRSTNRDPDRPISIQCVNCAIDVEVRLAGQVPTRCRECARRRYNERRKRAA